ncbi:MAG: crosslink repair DNA glycosylase YcaQ family protein, partial [Pseudomonadota bacterium]
MNTRPVLQNADARKVFLHRHLLSDAPSGAGKGDDLLDVITRLGFVQLDSINTVERAHHMILRARRMGYRPRNLKPLLEKDRTLFEHWTHDAAVIPTEFYKYWRLKMRRDADVLRGRWRKDRREGYEDKMADILAQIAARGPACSSSVGEDETRGSGGWWDWHPSKTALEYLWRSGALAVTHRRGFQKHYDLTERVLDESVTAHDPGTEETIDWLCQAALNRLGFATSGELAAFWDIASPAETKTWCAGQTGLIEVDVMGASGRMRRMFAREDVFDPVPDPPARLRILSPFDPALRDRKRAEWLFGFHYRIEIFV